MRRALPPGPFSMVAGVTAEAQLDLLEYRSSNGSFDSKLESELGVCFNNSEAVFPPRVIMESLKLNGAEPIARFRGPGMQGRPAVTRNRWRKGHVFYVATDCADNKFFETLAREAGGAANLEPLIDVGYNRNRSAMAS